MMTCDILSLAAGGLAAADQHEAGGRGVQLHQGDAARRHARGRGGGEVEHRMLVYNL